MPAAVERTKQLIPQLLGDSWALLAEKIQRMHQFDAPLQATGRFYVRHGRWPAPWIAWLMGMPAAGETVDLQLRVSQQNVAELWERSFAGRSMISRQYARADGLLIERDGATEVYFRVTVEEGSLHLQSISSAACLGRWRIPLPGFLGPRITARESVHAETGEIDVFVEVSLPLLGRLVTYGGSLQKMSAPVSVQPSMATSK